MKKGFLYFALLLVFGGILIQTSWVQDRLLIQVIHEACRDYFGEELDFQSFLRSEGTLILQEPQISSPPEGVIEKICAKELRIKYHWSWLKRRLSLEAILVQPSLSIFGQLEEEKAHSWSSSSLEGWGIGLSLSLLVEEGVVELRRDAGGEKGLHQLGVSAQYKYEEDGKGDCQGAILSTLNLGRVEEESNTLFVDVHWDSLSTQGLLKAKNLSASDLSSILLSFSQTEVPSWKVKQGEIEGELFFSLGLEQDLKVRGALDAQGVQVSHESLGLNFSMGLGRLFVKEASENGVLGEFVFEKETELAVQSRDGALWHFRDLTGKIVLENDRDIHLLLEGGGEYGEEKADFRLSGMGAVFHTELPQVGLTMEVFPQGRDPARLYCEFRSLANSKQLVRIHCENLETKEIAFVQTFAAETFPGLGELQVQSGQIDGVLELWLEGGRFIDQIGLEALSLRNVEFDLGSYGLKGACESCEGGFSLNFQSKKFLDSLQASLQLNGGKLATTGNWDVPWYVENMHADLSLSDGEVGESRVIAQFAGLQGQVEFNPLSHSELAKGHFWGRLQNVLPFLPPSVQEQWGQGFAEDDVSIEVQAYQEEDLRFEGSIELVRSREKKEAFHFGFHVGQVDTVWTSEESLDSKFVEVSQKALSECVPSFQGPMVQFCIENMNSSGAWKGLVLQKGWLRAVDLPMNKYVSPFLFSSLNGGKVEGTMSIDAEFDHRGIVLSYGTSSTRLETPSFILKTNQMGLPNSQDKMERLPGIHIFDFSKEKDFGYLSLQGASLRDQTLDLNYSEVGGKVRFEGTHIYITEAQARCCGVDFLGYLHLDSSGEEFDDLCFELELEEASGSLDQVSRLLESFDLSIPHLEGATGEVSLDKGAWMSLQKGLCRGVLKGSLVEGMYRVPESRVSLEGVGIDFEYNFERELFRLSNVKGSVFVGEGEGQQEYEIRAQTAYFTGLDKNQWDFDLRLEDSTHDFARLDGYARGVLGEEEIWEVHLKEGYTHLGTIYPCVGDLTYSREKGLLSLEAEPRGELSGILTDLLRIAPSGLLFVEKPELMRLQDLGLKGRVEGKVHYDPMNETYQFFTSVEKVETKEGNLGALSIAGKKFQRMWSIDQCKLGDFSLATDLERLPAHWKIHFLGLRYKNALLMGLEGEYDVLDRDFCADVNLLELDLQEWVREEFLGKSLPVEKGGIHGKLKASGELTVHFSGKGDHIFDYDGDFKVSYRDLHLLGARFANRENIHLQWTSSDGMTVDGLSALVTHLDGQASHIELESQKIQYRPEENHWWVDRLDFCIPPQEMKWLVQRIRKGSFLGNGEEWTPSLLELRPNEDIAGSLKGEVSPHHFAFQTSFEPGTYAFSGEIYDLKGLVFELSPYQLAVKAQLSLKGVNPWVTLRTTPENPHSGEIVIEADSRRESRAQSFSPLTIHWTKDEEERLQVSEIEGTFQGIQAKLLASPETQSSEHFAFEGELNVDGTKAFPFFPEGLQELARLWRVGRGYKLNGTFIIPREQWVDAQFKGILTGENFELLGISLNSLYAEIHQGPREILIQDVKVVDEAGKVRMGLVSLKKEEEKWSLEIPLVLAETVIPSKWQEKGEGSKSFWPDSFMIPRWELRELKGDPAEIKTLQGYGKLQFVNPNRISLRNTILHVPAEIIGRIGLDPDLLTPVVGSIFYEIGKEKIFLTELRDVYSEGRLSKFYLPEMSASYMDFDGNLNLKLGMRQYNLLFKIAEFFTLSVQGNVTDPRYSLDRKNLAGSDEEELFREKISSQSI